MEFQRKARTGDLRIMCQKRKLTPWDWKSSLTGEGENRNFPGAKIHKGPQHLGHERGSRARARSGMARAVGWKSGAWAQGLGFHREGEQVGVRGYREAREGDSTAFVCLLGITTREIEPSTWHMSHVSFVSSDAMNQESLRRN